VSGEPGQELWCISTGPSHNVVATGIEADGMAVTLFSDTACTAAISDFNTDGCKIIPSDVLTPLTPLRILDLQSLQELCLFQIQIPYGDKKLTCCCLNRLLLRRLEYCPCRQEKRVDLLNRPNWKAADRWAGGSLELKNGVGVGINRIVGESMNGFDWSAISPA
jgi:hypothetical protein